MTNKEYKPLTTGGYANPKMLPQYRDRLCYLEDCIEKGILVFLPCKVGNEFWYINKIWNKACIEQVAEFEVGDYGIVIVDTFGRRHSLERIYFSKEAAEKALEEMG